MHGIDFVQNNKTHNYIFEKFLIHGIIGVDTVFYIWSLALALGTLEVIQRVFIYSWSLKSRVSSDSLE